jgi:hypothetical protein
MFQDGPGAAISVPGILRHAGFFSVFGFVRKGDLLFLFGIFLRWNDGFLKPGRMRRRVYPLQLANGYLGKNLSCLKAPGLNPRTIFRSSAAVWPSLVGG